MTIYTEIPENTTEPATAPWHLVHPPRFENMLPEMKARPNWACWTGEIDPLDGRADKSPRMPNGYRASIHKPETWCSFDRAVAAYHEGGFAGVGYVLDGKPLSNGLVIGGIDIDHYSSRQEEAQRIVRQMGCYTEWSPGGDGLRLFCLARPLASGLNVDGIEIYTSVRFLTVTGALYAA